MNEEELHSYCKSASNEIIRQDEEIRKLIKENEKLKEALAASYYCKYANKCDDLMDCSREEYNSMCEENMKLYNENDDLKQENQKLKKQLEEINKFVCKCGYTNIEQVMLNYCGLLTKQKEFIKYLEDEIKQLEHSRYVSFNKFGEHKLMFYKEILSKYKEITGDDE